MSNYSRTVVINQETGEITSEYYTDKNKKWYHGPRKYWRVMELYDKAQLLLASKVGIHILIYIKNKVNVDNYRISINNTWLAEDIGTNRETVSRNIKKLVDTKYLIKEKRSSYFVNPGLFWIAGMSAERWKELKEEFTDKVNKENK